MTSIIAHRGASRAARENTVEAFALAADLGADMIELDVRRSADDRLVVHHDAVLDDGRLVRATPVADLPAHVPTLERALAACAPLPVNIEIKNDPGEDDVDPSEWVAHRLMSTLAGMRSPRRWLVSSFRLETVDRCRRLVPAIRTGWLTVGIDPDLIALTASRGHASIHPSVVAVDADGVVAAHRAGLAVGVWTCDDPDRIAELVRWGVDGVFTNVPDVAARVRASATA